MIQNLIATGCFFTAMAVTIGLCIKVTLFVASGRGAAPTPQILVCAAGWTGFVAAVWIF